MKADEALRFLAYVAKIKNSLHVPEIVKHNEDVAIAVNTLAHHLGINLEINSQPRSEDQR